MKKKLPIDGVFRAVAAMVLLSCCLAVRLSGAEIEIDSVMYDDPRIDVPPKIRTFSPKLKTLWLEALSLSGSLGEADLKRQAADAITLAHQRGMPNLEEAIGPLIKALDESNQHPVVVRAVTRALIELDARQAAGSLFQRAQEAGVDMALLVEPALLRWKYEPILEVWLARLAEPPPRPKLLVLAIRSVAKLGETKAEQHLLKLATGKGFSPGIRLEAARALGAMRSSGLESVAERLAADTSPSAIVNRLVAASLLNSHSGQKAEKLLLNLSVDTEPAVAVLALGRLFQIDPDLVNSIEPNTKILGNRDAKVRHLGARALAARPNGQRLELLAKMLDDPHPDVRGTVRDLLFRLAGDPKSEFDEPVRRLAVEALAGDRWRSLEQAAMLLGALVHTPAADRLVELLDHARPEVFIASAWSLRRLAVRSTLVPMFRTATRLAKKLLGRPIKNDVLRPMFDAQLNQLFQAFAQMNYTDSEPLLLQFVPRPPPVGISEDLFLKGMESRASAIWALGYLHAGKHDRKLSLALMSRLSDLGGNTAEDRRVRRMSAIALGRMKAEGVVNTLREFYKMDSVHREVAYGCAWALRELTGEDIPDPKVPKIPQKGWFIEPIE